MQKIPTLFQRNHETDRLVHNEVTPGCEWVQQGDGVATTKYDGTCCLILGGKLFKRYEVKPGKTPPLSFQSANEVDEVTGKQQGWLPVGDGPDDRWHREAFAGLEEIVDGTYELVGPKVQCNPHGFEEHMLLPHGESVLLHFPRDFDGIKKLFSESRGEGVVWHHPDGRMAKIKTRDFGFPWGKKDGVKS